MKTPVSKFTTASALCMMLCGAPAAAQTKSALDAGVLDTVRQFNLIDSRHQDLEDRAVGMLIFPQVTKGGIGLASEIILFMTRAALEKFTTSKGWSIGADTGIVVMTKGTVDNYDSYKFKKPVLVFMFAERGLIADVSLHGTKVQRIQK